jgi:predicted metal-dependent phosphoesterase TrpH
MPAGQPFTQLCQTLARPRYFGRVDLHLHTTFSDGAYTPAEIVDLARRSGLSAIAITDHDTLGAIAPTQKAAGAALEVVSGVEITAEWRGRELHLLGYFFDPNSESLARALAHLRSERIGRFHEMIERLKPLGVHFAETDLAHLNSQTTLGRRHLAEMLVKARKAATVREAFQRWLGDHGRANVPKTRLPLADAIPLLRQASGIAAWAHPNYDCNRDSLRELKSLGLTAIEAEYPSFRASRIKELRNLARDAGLAITGGSDCHGPGEPHRAVGAHSISHDELSALRQLI